MILSFKQLLNSSIQILLCSRLIENHSISTPNLISNKIYLQKSLILDQRIKSFNKYQKRNLLHIQAFRLIKFIRTFLLFPFLFKAKVILFFYWNWKQNKYLQFLTFPKQSPQATWKNIIKTFRGITVQKLALHYSMNNFLMTLMTKELLSSY